jgi:large subunit ribosomal protein L10
MPNKHNVQQAEMLKEKVAKAKSLAIVNYEGTTVADQVTLRQKLSDAGAEFLVAKNTLIALALEKENAFDDVLEGMNGVVFSYEDEVAGLKALFTFHKDTEKLAIKKGLVEDRVLTFEELESLSKLPGKDQLIAMVIARLNSPASGLVNVLKAGPRNLVYVLNALKEKKV